MFHENTNQLLVLRRERGLSRKQVCELLGYKCASSIRRLEQGKIRPNLETVLRLEILYRRPVAFMYSDEYRRLRDELRQRETRLPQIELLNAGGRVQQ